MYGFEIELYEPLLHVQFSPGSQVEFDGHAHCETELDPANDKVEFGHTTLLLAWDPGQYELAGHIEQPPAVASPV